MTCYGDILVLSSDSRWPSARHTSPWGRSATMNRLLGRSLGVLATAGLVFLSGCGSGAPPASSSTTEATVKGTVKINGKLATEGTITFDPTNQNRQTIGARKGTINKDGT